MERTETPLALDTVRGMARRQVRGTTRDLGSARNSNFCFQQAGLAERWYSTSCRSCRSLSFYPWLLAWHAVPFYCRLLLRPSRTSRIKAHPQTRRLPYPLVFPRLSLPAPPEPHSPCHHHVLTIPRELTAKQLFLL